MFQIFMVSLVGHVLSLIKKLLVTAQLQLTLYPLGFHAMLALGFTGIIAG